jgi:hypothetical protein
LDFLVDSSLDIKSVAPAVQSRLQGVNWLPAGTTLSVSKAKDAHNPHAFNVTVSGPNVLGSVKVKVELWQTAPEAMEGLQITVAPIQIAIGPASGLKTYVPTADLSEIYADKVFAVVARKLLKPRDVFDMHWLVNHNGVDKCSVEQMNVRLLTYPNMKPEEWLTKAFERRSQLSDEQARVEIASNLQRWLPSSWPMTPDDAAAMVKTSIRAIEDGIDVMRAIHDEHDRANGVAR